MQLRSTLTRVTIRSAIFISFALTFSLWLAAGYSFTLRLRDLETRTAAISDRYTRAQELLTRARNEILFSAVFVRDALIDQDPSSDSTYNDRMERAYRAADDALQQYVPVLNIPEERDRVAKLRRSIAEFRSIMNNVLAADANRRPDDARALLRSEVTPRREAAIRIAEDLQGLNRRAFVQNQAEAAVLYRRLQQQVWEILGIVLAGGIAIAAIATRYSGRLERDLRDQQAKDAQLSRELQRLSTKLNTAQEEERAAIARELHDDVGQLLTAMKVELARAERGVSSEPGASESIQHVRSIAEGAMQRVRDLSRVLHPPLLDDLGLATALDCHIRAFSRRHDLPMTFASSPEDRRMPAAVELCAYRIVQEALTNVVKHAKASNCRVTVQQLAETLVVRIEDDGRGFDMKRQQSADAMGLGLIGIRERVARLGGTLEIYSAPAHGTRITVQLPAGTRSEDPSQKAAPLDVSGLEIGQVVVNG